MSDVLQGEFLVLDTETTGFDPKTGHKIVEIGIVKVEDGEVKGKTYHQYVDPERDMPDEAYAVHGIQRQDAIEQGNGQVFKDIAQDVIDFCKGHTVIAHNANFDMTFLDFECEQSGFGKFTDHVNVIDTLLYANVIHPTKANNLDALAKRYGVDDVDRSLHGALIDSVILAKVFIAMRLSQQDLNIESVSNKLISKTTSINLKDLVERIDPNISNQLIVSSNTDNEIKEHKEYLSTVSQEPSW
jgi:DNA polymerase-3 subunit epsilon